jgi:3-methyl-2-oxobutanoate hydroxymethyltransferase
MSYQNSVEEAVRNAGRMVSEGNVGSVKLEGGSEFAEVISRIVRASVPVMAHIGLTPQSVHKMGGYIVQGRDEETARKLLDDAVSLEQAGCYALVMEGVPLDLAKTITARLSIPTIGIGAGKHCDGQVLVCYDLLGMNPDFKPKFVKRYANLYESMNGAAKTYFSEVREGSFPDEDHSFRSSSVRLVASNPDVQESAREEKSGVYGVPV